MPSLSRRRFLLALGAGGVLGGAAATQRYRKAALADGQLQTVTRSAQALGSHVAITALHADEAHAERAVAASFAELELVEQLMSLYRPDSQLCRLNRDGVLEDPHPYFVGVLQAAQTMSGRSGGAFDVTVQPLWQLFASAQRENRLPRTDEIDQARSLVDYRKLVISSQRVRLANAQMAVTLNGIAQGFAADLVAAVLAAHDIAHALIDTGELSAHGAKQDGVPWTAGIQHPRYPDAYLALAQLRGRALATSGDYATRFGNSDRDHHIFDPRTGRSPAELASVSVAATRALEADALSTAIMVLGPADGLQLIRATLGADALLVLKDGSTRATEGFPTV